MCRWRFRVDRGVYLTRVRVLAIRATVGREARMQWSNANESL